MSRTDNLLDGLRAHARSTIAANALALGFEPATLLGGPEPFQVALRPGEKALLLGGLRATGADKRIDRTLDQLTAGEFSPQERRALEERALDKIEWSDARKLQGIVEGPPVMLRPEQKAIIDRVMGGLGADPLADRARGAYGRATKNGQIRTR